MFNASILKIFLPAVSASQTKEKIFLPSVASLIASGKYQVYVKTTILSLWVFCSTWHSRRPLRCMSAWQITLRFLRWVWYLTLYILTSVCIFSIMFSWQFLRCWSGEFASQSRASSVDDHFLYSHDLHVWFKGYIVGRNVNHDLPRFYHALDTALLSLSKL